MKKNRGLYRFYVLWSTLSDATLTAQRTATPSALSFPALKGEACRAPGQKKREKRKDLDAAGKGRKKTDRKRQHFKTSARKNPKAFAVKPALWSYVAVRGRSRIGVAAVLGVGYSIFTQAWRWEEARVGSNFWSRQKPVCPMPGRLRN